jgi:hypothetical protein
MVSERCLDRHNTPECLEVVFDISPDGEVRFDVERG